MQKAERQFRKSEVARTGRIPSGTDVHHRHLRNPSIGYLYRVIRQTEALISSGECHPDWGRKRIEALRKMLFAKESRLEKKRVRNKHCTLHNKAASVKEQDFDEMLEDLRREIGDKR